MMLTAALVLNPGGAFYSKSLASVTVGDAVCFVIAAALVASVVRELFEAALVLVQK